MIVSGLAFLRRGVFVWWLATLYLGLLYLGVGALGVSELVGRYGDQAAMIFHVVSVVDQVRQQERETVEGDEAKLAVNAAQRDAAVAELRRFGVQAGLPLEKIQPVIDNYDLAPRLAALLGKPVESKVEQDWADRAAKVMELQLDNKRLQAAIDAAVVALRKGWASEFEPLSDTKGRTLSATDIEMAAGTAAALRRLGFGQMFLLPQELLTLVLALTMGGLGSTLQVTKALVEGDLAERASYYVVRPFQGMVTALVFYVVLKAGQLTISSGGAGGLNNFFIAFASIVSGLMSQQAYAVIEKAGATLLKADQGEPRWAFKLGETLAARGIDGATLAEGVGAGIAEMGTWLAEAQPVPAQYQRLIAVWLHMPERELFTNQAPVVAG